MTEPTKANLLADTTGTFDSDSLRFTGRRGDSSRHLGRADLEAGLRALPPSPSDSGTVALLVARGPNGERALPKSVELTVEGGMPGDRWVQGPKYGLEDQLATTRATFARLIANEQPLELHGDNLFLDLDLSKSNLPIGSRVRMGEALLEVTPKAHNGCKKWVQRFGLDAMQLSMAPEWRAAHLRGIYLRVIEAGRVAVGDAVDVVSRPS